MYWSHERDSNFFLIITKIFNSAITETMDLVWLETIVDSAKVTESVQVAGSSGCNANTNEDR